MYNLKEQDSFLKKLFIEIFFSVNFQEFLELAIEHQWFIKNQESQYLIIR